MGLIDIIGASALLGVKPATIRYWVQEKRIPHYKLGAMIRFSEDKLRAWVESGYREAQIKENGKWTTPAEVEAQVAVIA